MISERKLVASHTSLWHVMLPMSEAFVRTMNLNIEQFASPVFSNSAAKRHSLISELAFRIYVASLSKEIFLFDPETAQNEVVCALGIDVEEYISHLEQWNEFKPISDNERQEATLLARRIHQCISLYDARQPIISRPAFKGCGFLQNTEGDLLVGTTLYEIKNVERPFRSTDIRQLLTYCMLNAVSHQYSIDSVALLNPRGGTYYKISLNSLSLAVSGLPAGDLLSEIANYVSADRPSR